MLLVYGSMDSLFPRIWAVEAVGIGARSRLFLTPCLQERWRQQMSMGGVWLHALSYKLSFQFSLLKVFCLFCTYLAIFSFRAFQSQRSVGTFSHMSCCKICDRKEEIFQWKRFRDSSLSPLLAHFTRTVLYFALFIYINK